MDEEEADKNKLSGIFFYLFSIKTLFNRDDVKLKKMYVMFDNQLITTDNEKLLYQVLGYYVERKEIYIYDMF